MAAVRVPKEPLVAVMGTTGTGKSDLAIDLALRYNGEIINADAMQMYRGLPVITNQISTEEQRGIPHHLLAKIDPLEPTWTNGLFAREANKLIRDIRSRGKLPIVVGGTHYYIQSLLFVGNLVESSSKESDDTTYRLEEENTTQFPILNTPTNVMLERLRQVDPSMADRWHPDDRRKIRRSLEIYLTTGKRASDIYAEQQQAKDASAPKRGPWESLVFWVYTEPEVLKERLNKRVSKMGEAGLMDEARGLHNRLLQRADQGEAIERTRGIWQSIGYKQMELFLEGEKRGESQQSLEKLKETGLEEMRSATRQYAKYQLRWIRHKSIPAFREHDAMDLLYLLDSTDVQKFSHNVLEPAAEICGRFLEGKELAKPAKLSTTAREVLASFETSETSSKPMFKVKLCEACNMSLPTEDQWIKHINGRRHRRVLHKKNHTALVPIETETPC